MNTLGEASRDRVNESGVYIICLKPRMRCVRKAEGKTLSRSLRYLVVVAILMNFFSAIVRCVMSNPVDDRNPEEKKKEFCIPKMSKE